ncbi:MAG: DEAD/DEAH box helicase [Rectinemataceae bacterium]|jgi:ATP-dependent RNA helicase RhlB
MEFQELNLHPDLQKGIDEAGFTTCMPVQEMVFAHSLSGEDIYAQSQTGTGKTAAFLISIMQRIMTDSSLRTRKVLILAPTRELAVQIETEAKKLGKHLPITAGAFYGGVSYVPQIDMLRADVQIIVGTPGRVIDLLQQGKMLFKDVGFLVIDEADRMFDMGFIDDLRRLLRYLPPAEQRQTYLFSATLGLRVKDLAWEYMRDPKEISIEPEKVTVELVTQELYHVGTHEKLSLLLGLLSRDKPKSCLVFCNQKFMVEELARRLKVNGFDCEFIMGDLPQAKRSEVIERLKAGKIGLLVATDVAARGLDVEALDLVINYDVPEDAESYVHRIGRTARAGKSGKAITLACEKFVYGLYAIEKYLGTKIPVMPFDEALLLEDRSSDIRFSRDRGGEGRSRNSRQGVRGYGSGRGGAYAGGRPAPDKQEPRRAAPRRDEQRRSPEDERQQPPRAGQHTPSGEGQRQAQGQQRQPQRQSGAQKPPQAGQRPPQRQGTAPQRHGPATTRQSTPQGQGQQRQAVQRPQLASPTGPKAPVSAKKIGILDKIKKLFKKS